MYERFYRLRERPFALTPDPDYLYPSKMHSEALGYLRYGIETHAGFVMITGAIGSGKTTLLQTLLRNVDNRITVARVMNTLLDPRELIEAAMIDLGLEPAGMSKPAMLKAFGEFLVNERAAGRMVMLVIDEAQNLSLPALEEIRMLSNMETEKSKLVQILLIGQPDLRDKLSRPELEQLRQRITVSHHLLPLDADETARYINHRLARASIGAPLEFPRVVTDRIHDRSGGIPRLINVIADATLVFGYGEERSEIDEPLIKDVIADLDDTGVLGLRPNPERSASVVPVEQSAGEVLGLRAIPQPAAAALRPPPMPQPIPPMPQPVAVPAAVASPAALSAPAAPPPVRPAAAADIQFAERERQLREREKQIADREREVAEQRRVLSEQHRILKTAAAVQAPQPAAGGPEAPRYAAAAQSSSESPVRPQAAAHWPPRREPPAGPYRYVVQRRETRSFWRRVRDTLFGIEPVLEDSL
jgi:putative secretion ATPase (PEP-CTERM system associated)